MAAQLGVRTPTLACTVGLAQEVDLGAPLVKMYMSHASTSPTPTPDTQSQSPSTFSFAQNTIKEFGPTY